MAFFEEIEKLILKFIWNYEESQNSQNNLKKKNRRTHTSQFQNLLQSICEFTYLLEFVTPKSILAALALGVTCRHNQSGKMLSRPRPMFLTGVTRGCPLPSCFRSHP